jgi:hypothetical protein
LNRVEPDTSFTIAEATTLVRSKNAGPFWLTIDIMFRDPGQFARAVRSAAMRPESLAALLRVPAHGLIVAPVAAVNTIKISLPRPVSAGSPRDRDTLGGQQYAPLLGLRID